MHDYLIQNMPAEQNMNISLFLLKENLRLYSIIKVK